MFNSQSGPKPAASASSNERNTMVKPKNLSPEDKVKYAGLSKEEQRAFRHGFKDIDGNPTATAMREIDKLVHGKFFAEAINPIMKAVEDVEAAPENKEA